MNVCKGGRTVENAAKRVIENVMEEESNKRNNDAHARVQAFANRAVGEMWATKVVKDEGKNDINMDLLQSVVMSV